MKKILKVSLLSLFIIVIATILIIWIMSPGKAIPFVDENGNKIENSISEIEKIQIGGIDQYLIIRGIDVTKPVLLFLHGGPGSPEFPMMKDDKLILEKEFVIVHWEQRGSGKSLSKDIPEASMNLEQFISDASEVSEHLKKRFNREKIFLMGHSWGSFLGILTVNKHPQHFYSYIGIGQVASQFRAEQISFDWVKREAKKRNDKDAIKELSNMFFPDSLADNNTWLEFLMKERKYVNKYRGGLSREEVNIWFDIGKLILTTKEYTISDKLKFMKGNFYSMERLWSNVIQTNLFTTIDSIKIPVHIIQGVHDYQTPYIVANEFYSNLKAPTKTLHTFDNSAHTPFLDEVEKFNSIIKEIILTDKR